MDAHYIPVMEEYDEIEREIDSLVMKGEESCTVKICAADFVRDCAVKPGSHCFNTKLY